jgi:hypothetical protein
MPHVEDSSLFWILTVIQSCGLVSAWLTRRHAGSRQQSACELLFLACLILVGISTLAAMLQGHGAFWIFGGATLGVMVLMAVWDFKPSASTSASHARLY